MSCLPDEVTGLLETLGAEIAAVGKLGFCFQFHGLVFDLADSIPLGRRLREDPLRHRGLLAGILRQLGRLLLSERDDFQAPPLWCLLLPLLILLVFLDVLTIQTYDCENWSLLSLCVFQLHFMLGSLNWGEHVCEMTHFQLEEKYILILTAGNLLENDLNLRFSQQSCINNFKPSVHYCSLAFPFSLSF